MALRLWIGAGVALLAIGAVAAVALLGRDPGEREPLPTPGSVLERPEVRAPACPSNAAMVWAGLGWTMTIGPARINFPYAAVGPNLEVFAGGAAADSSGTRRPGALYQKLPLHIEAPPGTEFAVAGKNYSTGAPMYWDGPTSLLKDAPVSERFFVPGQMIFSGPGCYQVWIALQGERYGPFGFRIRSSNPGEILSFR
jgi:hypothetical protein